MASSASGYSALAAAGEAEKSLMRSDEAAVEANEAAEDEVQVNMNTESDDEEYLQTELADSYRPPSTAASSGPSTRSFLVIGVLVSTILLTLLVLTLLVFVYGSTVLSNMRAASDVWSNVLARPNPNTDDSAHKGADIPAVSDPADPIDEGVLDPGDEVPEIPDIPVYDYEYESSSTAAFSSSTADFSSASDLASSSSSSPFSSSSTSATASFLTSMLASAGTGSSTLQDKTAKPALLAYLSAYVARHYSANMTLEPDRKYIVFTPTDDGLGNKVLPLISSFFLALILDRTWLIHWVGTEAINNSKVKVESVFQPPDGMDWSWTNIVERTKIKQNKQNDLTIPDQNELFRTSLCDMAGKFGLSCSVYDMAGAGTEHTEDKVGLSCVDWRSEGRHGDNVFVNWGDQYYVPSIQVNKAYRPFILSLFDEDDIFGPLARFLLRPSAAINVYISDMQQRFWTDRYVVSMQIRRRERLGLRDNEVDTAVKCAKRLAVAGKAATGKEVTFFVASDDEVLRDNLIGRMKPEGQVVHVANFSIREQQDGVFFAAIDVMLLSRGDAIVTTPSSTFGYISAGFGSLVPERVHLSGTECDKAVNSEPSSHFFHSMVAYSKDKPFCLDFSQFDHLMKQEICCPRW